MSHFIGIVFKREDDDLDEILAPFDEQSEYYAEFVDRTDEVKKKWNELPDTCPSEGTYEDEIDRTDVINEVWDAAEDVLAEEYKGEDAYWKPYTKDLFPTPADIARDKEYEVVEDAAKRNGVRFVQRVTRKWEYEPSKEKYPTEKDLATKYFGYRCVNGKYGYMSNPNAKYDWYAIGNRWDGFIINKEGKETNVDFLTEIDWEKTATPFCFVDVDGRWIERGEMGWFCVTSNEKKKDDWDAEFKAYVQSLLADSGADKIEVVAVDFHI